MLDTPLPQFITEQRETGDLPSRPRRAAVTLFYLLAGLSLSVLALGALLEAGLISSACFDRDVCSGLDHIVSVAIAAALALVTALVIALGWRGRLLGARKA